MLWARRVFPRVRRVTQSATLKPSAFTARDHLPLGPAKTNISNINFVARPPAASLLWSYHQEGTVGLRVSRFVTSKACPTYNASANLRSTPYSGPTRAQATWGGDCHALTGAFIDQNSNNHFVAHIDFINIYVFYLLFMCADCRINFCLLFSPLFWSNWH